MLEKQLDAKTAGCWVETLIETMVVTMAGYWVMKMVLRMAV